MHISSMTGSTRPMVQREGDIRFLKGNTTKTITSTKDLKNSIAHWESSLPHYLKPEPGQQADTATKALSAFVGKFRNQFHLVLKPHKSPIIVREEPGLEQHVATVPFSFPQDAPGKKNPLAVIRTAVWDSLFDMGELIRQKSGHKTFLQRYSATPRESLEMHLLESDFAKLKDAQKATQEEENPAPIKMNAALLKTLQVQDRKKTGYADLLQPQSVEAYMEFAKKRAEQLRQSRGESQ
jgi:hypothetical protein